MVTVRTYLDGAQAAIAKSLLDDYEIESELMDENAHMWCRAPWAVPIRLVVNEDQAERARKLLDGDLEGAATIQEREPRNDLSEEIPGHVASRNPWELLLIAFFFLLPGLCFLQFEYPATQPSFALRHEFASVAVTHFLGWVGIAAAIFFVGLYFYGRRPLVESANTNDVSA